MKTLAVAAAVLAFASPAIGADIWVGKPDNFVFFRGPIVEGDYAKFSKATAKKGSNTIIVFKSTGGAVLDAIQIGTLIRAKKFSTVVIDMCASACALAWLGGVHRGVYSDASVGFHSVKNSETGEAMHGGNAVVGAYLGKLGFSLDAIFTMTEAKPDEMTWMTDDMARKLGIKVEVLTAPAKKEAPKAKTDDGVKWPDPPKANVAPENKNGTWSQDAE